MSESKLLLDFGANRKVVRNKRVFSNSLEDQFKNLPLGDDYEDFVRYNFIRKDCKVLISYPNFRRELSRSKYGQYYNNIALRFPNMEDEGRDVVLMCDIFEKDFDTNHPERPINRTFQVKSILLMDPNIVHFGEIERTCEVVINLGEREGTNWESEEWYGRWLTEEHLRSNMLSNDFLMELSQNYVVQSPDKVKTELYNWRRYIESREYIVGVDSKNGYCLDSCRPEFFRAFSTTGDFQASDYGVIEHLDPKAKGWTIEKVNADSREALLMHIYVDVPEKDYLESKGTRDNPKSMLDRFTRAPLFLEDENSETSNRQSGYRLRIADRRLHISTVETVEPIDKIESIKAECDKRIESAKKKSKSDMASEVDRRLQAFEHSSLPELVEMYSSEQRSPITNRISADYASRKAKARDRLTKELEESRKKSLGIKAKIEALKAEPSENGKADSRGKQKKRSAGDQLKDLESSLSKIEASIKALEEELDTLDDTYNPSEAIGNALKDACNAFSENRIAEERESIESGLTPEYDERLNLDIAAYQSYAEDAIDEAKREGNIARFHLFFEIEVSDGESIEGKMKSLSWSNRNGLKLNRDLTGEKIILARQKEALENLEGGYVLNPFLATFLFSPKSEGRASLARMDDEDFIDKSLNDSQKEAVQMAMSSNGLFLIQGPPGTGKTQVIAEISAQLAKSNRKVLIASQNNKAVDNAFDRMPKIPSVRLLRVLSEKATKQGNDYSIEELVSNFYKNISESIDNERRNLENRTIYKEKLESSIDDLERMYKRMEACQDEAKAANEAIAEAKDNLRIAFDRKDEIERSNRFVEEQIEEKKEAISSVEDLSDDNTFKMVAALAEDSGLDLASPNADPRDILKMLHSVGRDSIIKEYSSIEEHGTYFEYFRAKEAATDPKEKARLNKLMKNYREAYDFDPQESIPFLSILDKRPDMDAVLKAKDDMDLYIASKAADLNRSAESMESGMRSTDEVDNEIRKLKKEMESLEKDTAHMNLKDAEGLFDARANEVYSNLRIPMPGNRSQVLTRLTDELERFDQTESEKDEIEERIRTYNDIISYVSDESIIEQDRDSYKKQLLDTVNVFGMTCSAKASFKGENSENINLNERNIDVVIVDEVSKVPFVEVLQPILFGKTVILVGDHRQLPPMFDRRIEKGEDNSYDPKFINESDEEMYKKMYEESFFAKLFNDAPSSMKVQLSIQYRMHPDIMDVVNMFYRLGSEKGLTFGGNEVQKKHYLEITGASGRKVIGEDNHVLFVDVRGKEKKESGSTSYTNPEEVSVVLELLRLIDRNTRFDGEGNRLQSSYKGKDDSRLSVGVICAYADQAKEIRKRMGDYRNFSRNPDSPFMVKTVDDFQGDERDIIILSLVRSRESQFLSDYRRINVAISRARRLLIIVGNRTALEQMRVDMDGRSQPVYRNILKSIERKDGMRTKADIIGGE